MYAEERHVEAKLRAKERDLHSVHDQLQALNVDNFNILKALADEEDRAKCKFHQHQRDVQAYQAEADHLDDVHQAHLCQFPSTARKLECQLARGKAGDDQLQSPGRFQRNYPPRHCRFSPARPSGDSPSASIAQTSAPLPYQSAPKASCEARLSL